MKSAAVRHLRRVITMKIICAAFVFLVQTLPCLASDDSPFQLTNKETGFCLVKRHNLCHSIRWTTGDRLLVPWTMKCVGVQGKTVGSEISLYDCDETSELQKWECRNETVLALKGQDLYIELTADNTAVLSKTIGANNHLTISGTSSGACSRTYRELYSIGGNANGRVCMFPFMYNNQWFSDCTMVESQALWCAVETKFDHQLWGFCPTNTRQNWQRDLVTGAYYQLNTQAALTWPQAEASCKQQVASLLSITDPHQLAYVTGLFTAGGGHGYKLWTGLTLDPEHGWQWSNGKPYRYLNWDSGHPQSGPGYNCAIMDGALQYSWQSSTCTKKLGYICYSEEHVALPTGAAEAGFCSRPWIPYNGHCFHLNRSQKTWTDAKTECRKEGGDLVSIRNVEDQSFIISQLGYASTDELWIGLNDRKKEGLFDWTDHASVSFTSWQIGNPSAVNDQEDCVLISGENGNWADRVCEEKHGFICMKTGSSEPSGDEVEQNTGCKSGWKRHGSYCYFVGTETKTFDEAKDHCKSSESYLADVTNGVDNAFLVSLVGLRPEKHFWLGLSNQRDIDSFVWTNTDSVRFTHWNAQMPGHRQGCVAMATGIYAGLWDILPCTNKEKYICKHLAEGAVLTPAPQTVAPPSCAQGWTRLTSSNMCYKVYSEPNKRTWYEARDYCRAIGGDLLSIHSTTELNADRSYQRVWIGLSAPDPVTGYVWSDGSPVNFQNWDDGEPNNKNNVESCAELILKRWDRSGSWNDVHCEKYNGWVCQIRAGATPKPPPDPVTPDFNRTSDGWLEWRGNQYYINQQSMANEEARRFCKQRHGDLATINSEDESVFLWKRISSTGGSYWIGLTVDFDETFEWMDGSQVVFQRWDVDQPDFKNYDENCVIMGHYTGFWHDYNCGYEHKSICKRSSSPPANTTAPPTVVPKGGCPTNWIKINSKCYSIVNNQNLTWDGGRKQCQAMGGNLVTIPSRHVQVFLISQMAVTPTSDLWIGLRSLPRAGFYWTDGQPRRYMNMDFQRRHYSPMFDRPRWHMHPMMSHRHRFLFRHHEDIGSYFSRDEKQCAKINADPSLDIGKWIPTNCNDTNGFICARNVDPAFSDSPEPTLSTSYVKIFNDSLKVVAQQMTWDAANTNCEGDGAKLASLLNDWTHSYVELMALNLKAPLWIGLKKMQTGGSFTFIDGWRMSISHWAYGEPRDRPCVYVDTDGKWKTSDCNRTMMSVCMKSTDVPPAEPTGFPGVCPEDPDSVTLLQRNYWMPFRDYCYIFFTAEKDWPDASVSCQRHGGVLASIEDLPEQQFIQSNVLTFKDSQSAFWIGLFKTHKGEWLWLDQTVMDYSNWADSQPDRVYSHGEISTSDGKWKASYHRFDRGYICKTPKVLPPTVSSSSSPSVLHPRHRVYIISVVVIISGIIIGAIISFFLFKKNNRLPILEKLTAFDNPLFSEQSPPDTADTSKLVENMEEKHPEPETHVI